MKGTWSKVLILALFLLLVALFFTTGAKDYLTLEYLKSQKDSFTIFYSENKLITLIVYFAIYVSVTALSLPGAAALTIAGGAIFGVLVGTVAVSFSSTLGATLAFLTSRYLLKDAVQKKFGDRLEAINSGVEKEGAFYLFTLRLVPAIPFFVINLVMGITSMRTAVFFTVSQIGMLPGTIVYVNAGTQLAKIESVRDILSLEIIGSFILLGIFPLVTKKVLYLVKPKN